MIRPRLSVVRAAVVLALLASVVDCTDQTVDRPPPAPAIVDETDDGGAALPPPPVVDASPPPRSDGGCPPPRALAPAEVGPGYLSPANVTLVRPVDGDTAEFAFPQVGDKICRFLFVDTEESFGDRTTPFGIETKRKIEGVLRAAKSLVVVVHEAPGAPGQPELDAFDRQLSLVFVDGALLQTRLVREGLSPYFTPFGCATEPIHSTLLHAEAEANAADRGIWAPGHPTDYEGTTRQWIGRPPTCRPNPFLTPYCP